MIAFRKVWRDLWNYKGRTLLVVLSIAVGVMALGMTTASNSLLRRGIADSRAASRKPDARLTFVQPFNDDVVTAVTVMPEVAEAEGRLNASIRWKPTLASAWKDATLTVVPDYQHQIFDLLELKAGAWPARDQIAIEYNRPEYWGVPALGASSGDVAFIFMGEGLLLGVLSWAVAVPLSMLGAQFFFIALSQALNFPFFYTYSFNGLWIWLSIILLLSVVASGWPARRATQISVRESLAYE